MDPKSRTKRSELSILLVEDNPEDVRQIREMLGASQSASFELLTATRLSAGIARLAEGGVDLVLLNLSLPDSQGLDTLIQMNLHGPGIPVVVITGTEDSDLAIQAVQEGAQDYLVKEQMDGHSLSRTLHSAVERHRMQMELNQYAQRLTEQVRQQQALLQIGQAVQEMAAPEDLIHVVKVCWEELQGLGMAFRGLSIHRLIDEDRRVFETYLVLPSGKTERIVEPHPALLPIWQNGKTVYCRDLEEDPGDRTPEDLEKSRRRYGGRIRCFLDVPHAWGTFSLSSTRPNAFSESEVRFVEQVIQVVSMGLSRVEDLELLGGMIRCLPEGVCLVDSSHRLAFVNPAAQAYLRDLGNFEVGDEISHIGGTPLADLLVERDEGLPHEVAAETPSPCVFEVKASPVREESAGGGWTLLIRDVTQEREAQQKIEQQNRLASVGQLAAGIAHDFNNLLTVMMGSAQLLGMREDVSDAARDDLDNIYTQGRRAAQMIRQILDFSRKSGAERQPVDLAPFVKETMKMMHRVLPESIRVKTEFGDGPFMVNANLSQLQQVLTNLVVNARDAMPKGGELRLGLSRIMVEPGDATPVPGMGPGAWAVWAVSDTGEGMPPEVLARLYEPFFTTKKPGEGTGLGLAQVHGLVAQHEGVIDVESRVGSGTTFRIYLPMVDLATASSEEASGMPQGHGETILLVEDDPGVLRTARAMAEGLQYRVLTASNGRKALDVYEAHRDEIALVLTDLVMPEMSGMELMRILRQGDPGIRVVFMTGYSAEANGGAQTLSEADGFLPKPLVLDQMAQVIEGALNRAGEWAHAK